jgi:catechol 2,3-dioxygenase-like lactoylglutathione lyase family enzyme
MSIHYRASRDVIIRTEEFAAATQFYENVLGLPILEQTAA